MELWTAFLLGLLGSLHCAGMCGPLVLAREAAMPASRSLLNGRMFYNAGRLTTYTLLGGFFGAVGQSFALLGLQRWVSIAAGVLILLALVLSSRLMLNGAITRGVALLKKRLGKLLVRPGGAAGFFLGNFNGLLPCGLVYAACAGAAATGGTTTGMGYMLVFGLGTVPMMLGVALAGKKLQFTLRFKLEKLIPGCLVMVALLLILRGLGLGIPYLSPNLEQKSCCPVPAAHS